MPEEEYCSFEHSPGSIAQYEATSVSSRKKSYSLPSLTSCSTWVVFEIATANYAAICERIVGGERLAAN